MNVHLELPRINVAVHRLAERGWPDRKLRERTATKLKLGVPTAINNVEDDEVAMIQRRKLEDMLRRVLVPDKGPKVSVGEPVVLTDSNFSVEVARHRLMVVDFWASWCGPCRMIAPLIEELAAEYVGRVAFGKMNVDENRLVSGGFGVRGIPTLMVFKDGVAVDTIVGACSKGHIESRFKPYLESGR